MEQNEQAQRAQARRDAVAERLARLNKRTDKNLGLSVLDIPDMGTVIVKVDSEIYDFTTKKGKTIPAVLVTNLETGESNLTLFVGGQLKAKLKSWTTGFIGQEFVISHTGKEPVELEIKGEMQIVNCNQYEVQSLAD